METQIMAMQAIVFTSFFIMERVKPARHYPDAPGWNWWWAAVQLYAAAWTASYLSAWPGLPLFWSPMDGLSDWQQLLIGYAVYSFAAYWWHRAKHRYQPLWHYLHFAHHAVAHMETRVAFWRHPIEILANSAVIIIVARFGLGLDATVIWSILVVEGTLESFHHANVNTPRWLRPLGYVVQIPEQHLVHHQRGLHRFNYATITFWDAIFGTLRLPEDWNERLGVSVWPRFSRLLYFRY